MPRREDVDHGPNYDTTFEKGTDMEPHETVLKRRCQCSTKATIKTTYNREGVIYHCSDTCRQWWMTKSKPIVINKTERNAAGFTVA